MPTKRTSEKKAGKKQSAQEPGRNCCVVGIGSSAGGLEALRSLFGALQPTKNLSFVVVQHLSPVHRSRLVELVGHSTNLQVKEVQNGLTPKAGIVYITPPNKDVRMERGKLRLQRPSAKIGPKPSVDLFFRSLAEDAGESAVGIVLSGTGSDGSLGIRAIKSVGGVTISQKSDSAKYDGMPKSASHTGMVDLELTPQEIADELFRIDQLDARADRTSPQASPGPTADPYEEILKLLGEQTGVSFDQYKQNTIRRRVERRITATQSKGAADYVEFLRANPEEAKNLIQDILISVTSFFRDADSFRCLSQIVTERLKKKNSQASFRAWIVGCATGEEAYSVAIVLCEALEKLKLEFRPQIFASDLDEAALEYARKGIYPRSAFLDFPAGWREKYFLAKDQHLQVRPELRDLVIFARHNITEDPPFLDLDLLTCRNVMIYFTSALQEQVMRTFQYALNRRGLLFIGRSETVPTANKQFDVLDKQHRIYERNDHKGPPRVLPAKREFKSEPPRKSVRSDKDDEQFLSLMAGLAPDSVLVDQEFHLKRIFGRAGMYLQIPPGNVTHDLTRMVHPSLGYELGSMLRLVQKNNETATGRLHEIKIQGKKSWVRPRVVPLFAEGRTTYLVTFLAEKPEKNRAKAAAGKTKKLPRDEEYRKLQRELDAAREQLQTILEEQETSTEELQALNEEMQSANEELQSTNEELETTNEELQSTNEELITLNEEVNVKSSELLSANLELQATQNAISYPLLVLNRKRQLIRFNSAARFLFRLNDGDLGSNLADSISSVDFLPLFRLIDQALKKNGDAQQQLNALNRSFDVQVQAIRNLKNEVDGVVVSFVENSEIVMALEESRTYRDRLSSILENTLAMVSMKDIGGVYLYANRKFYETTGKSQSEVIGRTDEEIFGPETGAILRENDLNVVNRKAPIQIDEHLPIGKEGLHWATSRFPLYDRQGRIQSVCSMALDISDRIADQQTIASQQDELSRYGKFSAIAEISAGIAHEVNTPLNVITTKTDLLRKLAEKGRLDVASATRLADDVDRMAKNISSIVLGLKSIAGLEAEEVELVSIQKIVNDALKICEFRLQRFAVEVIDDLPNTEATVSCFPVQIIQVLINLINNSIEAMKDRPQRWIRITMQESPEEYLLRVTDAGKGIPEEIAEKIMTPFFTTKKDEQGTGIGLSLSRSIARRHGGDLTLDRKSANTSFVLSVPKNVRMPDGQ